MAAPFAKKIYGTKAWKQCRDAYRAYRHGICERCGAPGDEVHHKEYLTPANINDPEVVFGWNNLELLCRSCHIEEHEKRRNLKQGRPAREADIRIMFDSAGNPVPRGQIRIVWGSPASGKSAYVREHMQHMDIVVDLDRITSCFTGLTRMDSKESIEDYLPAMLAIRQAVYKAVRDTLPGIRTVWIVAGLPKKSDRQQMSMTFPGAQFIFLESTLEKCLANMEGDETRADKERQRRIITNWFRNFEPGDPPIRND
jgi:predicted kinase